MAIADVQPPDQQHPRCEVEQPGDGWRWPLPDRATLEVGDVREHRRARDVKRTVQWLRDAKRQLDEKGAAEQRPIPRSRPRRLKEAKRRGGLIAHGETFAPVVTSVDYARGRAGTAPRRS
jgi:hypothetical protein